MKFKQSLLAASLAAALSTPAHAALLTSFVGMSVFGDTDGTPGGATCPLCDSTVSFAVWENESGNWLNDSFFANAGTAVALAPFSTGVDTAARYVYLYQVNNTDPLAPPEQELENFNITWISPPTSGGYLDTTTFSALSGAVTPLDVPNDHSPSLLTSVGNLVAGSGLVNADSLERNVISSPAVQNGTLAAEAMLFSWNANNRIQPGNASSVVFLTSDQAPRYTWAESESPGGFGTAGDVPSAVPVPATLSLLAIGLVGMRRARRG